MNALSLPVGSSTNEYFDEPAASDAMSLLSCECRKLRASAPRAEMTSRASRTENAPVTRDLLDLDLSRAA